MSLRSGQTHGKRSHQATGPIHFCRINAYPEGAGMQVTSLTEYDHIVIFEKCHWPNMAISLISLPYCYVWLQGRNFLYCSLSDRWPDLTAPMYISWNGFRPNLSSSLPSEDLHFIWNQSRTHLCYTFVCISKKLSYLKKTFPSLNNITITIPTSVANWN